MADLFDTGASAAPENLHQPLADRLRPRALAEVIGQSQVLGQEGPLTVMLASGALSSLIIIPLLNWWGAAFEQPWYPETEQLMMDGLTCASDG